MWKGKEGKPKEQSERDFDIQDETILSLTLLAAQI